MSLTLPCHQLKSNYFVVLLGTGGPGTWRTFFRETKPRRWTAGLKTMYPAWVESYSKQTCWFGSCVFGRIPMHMCLIIDIYYPPKPILAYENTYENPLSPTSHNRVAPTQFHHFSNCNPCNIYSHSSGLLNSLQHLCHTGTHYIARLPLYKHTVLQIQIYSIIGTYTIPRLGISRNQYVGLRSLPD